jgi:hypothetical protein
VSIAAHELVTCYLEFISRHPMTQDEGRRVVSSGSSSKKGRTLQQQEIELVKTYHVDLS